MLERLVIYVALAGSLIACGFGFGYGFAQSRNERAIADALEKREKEVVYIDRVVTKYVDKVIDREIPIYVKNDGDCEYVSAGFRVYHDSLLSETPRVIDAAPAPFEDVANTIGYNYTQCLNNSDQLTALQTWARKVSE